MRKAGNTPKRFGDSEFGMRVGMMEKRYFFDEMATFFN